MFLQTSKSSQHQCPLLNAQTLYIPASVERVVTVRGTNLPQVRYLIYIYSVRHNANLGSKLGTYLRGISSS